MSLARLINRDTIDLCEKYKANPNRFYQDMPINRLAYFCDDLLTGLIMDDMSKDELKEMYYKKCQELAEEQA